MSISQRKLAANRANAQKRTGPTSIGGREKVSYNSTSHGLCGRFRDLPSEDQSDYEGLFERFLQSEQPADAVEPATEEQRTRNAQNCTVMKDLHIYVRYQAHHDRAYQRASSELLRRKKERKGLSRAWL